MALSLALFFLSFLIISLESQHSCPSQEDGHLRIKPQKALSDFESLAFLCVSF